MNNDFSELIEHIDKKFSETNSAVFAIKADVKDLTERISKIDDSLLMLINSVDALAKTVKDLQVEYSAVLHKVNRMEEWIKKASGKLGIDFSL